MLDTVFYFSLGLCLFCALIMALILWRSRIFKLPHKDSPAFCDLIDYATLADDNVIVLKSGALLSLYEVILPDLSVMPDTKVLHIYDLCQKALLKLVGNYCVQVDLVRQQDQSYLPFVESNGSMEDEAKNLLQRFELQRAQTFANQGSFTSHLYLGITYIGVNQTTQQLERLLLDENQDKDALRQTYQLIDDFKQACQNVIDTLELCFKIRPLGACTYLPTSSHHLKDSTGTTGLKALNQSATPLLCHGHATKQAPALASDTAAGEKQDISALAERKWQHTQGGQWAYHLGLSFIHQCLTGKTHAIAVPSSRCYLDAILATEDFAHGYTPKVGSKSVAVIAIEGLPSRTHEGLLNALGTLPFTYRFNTRFVYFDNLKSTLLLEKYRRYWAQKSKGLLAQVFNLEHARVNQNALDQVEEIDQAKRALDNNEVVFGSYTATLILMDESLEALQHKAKEAIQAIEDIGLSARVETVNATEGFLGSLPGHYYENLRRPIVSQDVLVDLLPLSVPDCGDQLSPNPLYGQHSSSLMQVRTNGLSNFYLNLHEQDLGNALVIGPSGSGKSVLLGELMLNLLRYPGMRIFAFDKGYSFYGLTHALGGNHITFDNQKAALCPLEKLEGELDFDYAQSYLEMLLTLNGLKVQPQDRNELMDCLKILSFRPSHKRTLSDLHLLLANRHLKEALVPYTKLHNDHVLLDGDHNLKFGSAITTFECADIFQASENFALPVLKQIFHLIAQQFDGKPVAIILDEAWLMLKDPTFARELIHWFKTLRKFNAIVILATQSLTDLEQSPHFVNLLECAKTRFYLPNYDATTPLLRPIYQRLGLENKEIELIASMIPKKDYYFCKNTQRTRFNLVLSPEELALLSLAGNKDKALVDSLYSQYGSNFYAHLQPKPSSAKCAA